MLSDDLILGTPWDLYVEEKGTLFSMSRRVVQMEPNGEDNFKGWTMDEKN
jgi:hypothetical protein